MTLKSSESLRNTMAKAAAIALEGGKLYIYTGPVPATAETPLDPVQHILLCTLTENDQGGGLEWESVASGGGIQKAQNQAWSGTVVEDGPPTFFRLCEPNDDGSSDGATKSRAQGTVGQGGADLNTTQAVLTSGTTFDLNFARLTQINGA
jgi:hypothetical protein